MNEFSAENLFILFFFDKNTAFQTKPFQKSDPELWTGVQLYS